MLNPISLSLWLAVVWLAVLPGRSAAQLKTRFNWTAVTGAQSGIFMAHQEGFFKKNGLDVELIHIPSSSRAIQTILAGEIALSFMDGNNAAQANLKGANLVLVTGATNRMVFSLMAKPEIKAVGELKGKKIGITRVGSSTHTAALFALGQGGLKPGDYQILPLVEVPNIFTALSAGQIDAGVVSPPTNSRARKAGFRELVNLAKEGPEYVSVAIGTSRSYLKNNEEVVRRLIRAYGEGLYAFKTNKAAAMRMIQKYLKVSDAEIQEDTYSQFREYLQYPPYVSRKGMEAVLADVAEKEPAARSAKADDFLDMRLVAELEKAGVFRKVAAR
ncbi:MAG TPA: ABC transporter substrate-binding protein [candidate division Zixibacteria bacterium]|nr:ABC transporter substrate-binding protein [candidate division Zixibacteria bacterium]